jgi:FkbH-like protein
VPRRHTDTAEPVKLIEALRIIGGVDPGLPERPVELICGFTPLHLETFLRATLQQRVQNQQVVIRTGLFGDMAGNIERARDAGAREAAILIEWADLDPRLGWRSAGGWLPEQLADIVETTDATMRRSEAGIAALADAGASVALSMPTLPLPPASFTPGWLNSEFETRLHALLAGAVVRLASMPRVRVVNQHRLAMQAPLSERADPRAELATGFPYRQAFAGILARLVADAMIPPPPKKGLVTDLDDTLWRGVLGDVGVDGIACSLDRKAQVHAIYQQLLVSLAASGALLAIASKNEPEMVSGAFAREDLIVREQHFFPSQVHWRPKSESIETILQSWNVAADSVVFVDDSEIELAEVQARFPEIECLLFPKDDPAAVVVLVSRLRDLFGKERLHEEDRLRLDSLRANAALHETAHSTSTDLDSFLAGTGAELRLEFDHDGSDARLLELVNKTNQFNLNGRRYTEQEWQAQRHRPDSFVLGVTYADKFGKLGKIAVVTGRRAADEVHVDCWVMSCRAFSRRIEFQCLQVMFDRFGAERILLDFSETPRNSPLRDFLRTFFDSGPLGTPLVLTREQFQSRTPHLHHTVHIVSGSPAA